VKHLTKLLTSLLVAGIFAVAPGPASASHATPAGPPAFDFAAGANVGTSLATPFGASPATYSFFVTSLATNCPNICFALSAPSLSLNVQGKDVCPTGLNAVGQDALIRFVITNTNNALIAPVGFGILTQVHNGNVPYALGGPDRAVLLLTPPPPSTCPAPILSTTPITSGSVIVHA
jgi:hypothetical protein